MNGRVYDYNLGRFLSVDPLIHPEGGSQGINPYSYMMNNPLSGTDPTGYDPDEEVQNITKTERVSTTGSRLRHTVTKTLTINSEKTATIHIESSNGAALDYVAGRTAGGLSSSGLQETTKIGNQVNGQGGGILGTTTQREEKPSFESQYLEEALPPLKALLHHAQNHQKLIQNQSNLGEYDELSVAGYTTAILNNNIVIDYSFLDAHYSFENGVNPYDEPAYGGSKDLMIKEIPFFRTTGQVITGKVIVTNKSNYYIESNQKRWESQSHYYGRFSSYQKPTYLNQKPIPVYIKSFGSDQVYKFQWGRHPKVWDSINEVNK